MKSIIVIFLLVLSLIAKAQVCDLDSARRYYDSHARSAIEGIWVSTTDGNTYLIRQSSKVTRPYGSFEIILLQDDSARLAPGTEAGSVASTASSDEYRISMGKAVGKRNYAAKLSGDATFLSLEGAKVEFTFNPLGFMSGLRRVFNMRFKNPTVNLPKGFVRIYPEPRLDPVKL